MKKILILLTLFTMVLCAEELKIEATSFSADEIKGESVFSGNVKMVKSNDRLNASKVIIYTNKENKPTKFVATGGVTFAITTKDGVQYTGNADRVVYITQERVYHFYKNVHLKQIDEKKEIQGDEVVLNITTGKAHATGVKNGPVIMIFDIPEKE